MNTFQPGVRWNVENIQTNTDNLLQTVNVLLKILQSGWSRSTRQRNRYSATARLPRETFSSLNNMLLLGGEKCHVQQQRHET